MATSRFKITVLFINEQKDFGSSLSDETEVAPTGSFWEVDTKETTTVEATIVEEDPVSLERKVDDPAGLIQAQEKKLGPDVEAGGQLGAEETMPASTEQKEEEPNEAAPSSHGRHFYQAGDSLTGTVNCIDVDGVWLEHCGLDALIAVKVEDGRRLQVGDDVQAEVHQVEEDGTLIMSVDLELVDGDDATE